MFLGAPGCRSKAREDRGIFDHGFTSDQDHFAEGSWIIQKSGEIT